MKCRYYVEGFDEEEYAYEIDTSSSSAENAADDCAEDWHNNHDGWEVKSWPLWFRVQLDDGPWYRCKVDREISPYFTCYESEEVTP